MIGLRYGRGTRLESDTYGFRVLVRGPATIRAVSPRLMDVLDAAKPRGRPPEFRRPTPARQSPSRIARAIAERFPRPRPALGLRRGDGDFAAHVLRAAPETRL